MRYLRSHLWLLCAGLVLLSGEALAKAGAPKAGPTETLKEARAKVEELLDDSVSPGSAKDRKRDKKLKRLISKLFDFEELARSALGTHWDARSKKERKEYVDVLTALIEMNYVHGLKAATTYSVEYLGETIVGATATVRTNLTTTTKKKKKPITISIDYKLRTNGSAWRVTDIITDEDSLVELYRSEFNKVVTKDSFEVLMNKLRAKLEEGPRGEGAGGATSGAVSGGAVPPAAASSAHAGHRLPAASHGTPWDRVRTRVHRR